MSNQTRAKNEIAKMKDLLKDLCTTEQAAEILGVGDNHIRLLIQRDRIAAVKLGNVWIVSKSSLEKYRKSKSAKGRPPSGAQP